MFYSIVIHVVDVYTWMFTTIDDLCHVNWIVNGPTSIKLPCQF